MGIDRPRHVTGYLVAALVAVAAGTCSLFYFGTGAPKGKGSLVPPGEGALTDTGEDACRELLETAVRLDDTHVDGVWNVIPGCAEDCPVANKSESVVAEKSAGHVGPRGGRFHYNRNGKKVYERHV
jgi:hypothetical protein